MSPQFVDFDGDGHLDIVAGTFDGSPHVALGSAQGYLEPTHILDAKGERILANQFWNYDAQEWQDTLRCDPTDVDVESGQITSAVAFDWDGDGDLDLLLGDYSGGQLFLRRNDGKPGAPAFASTNEPVLAAGRPIKVDEHLMTVRLVDWDGDGSTDLLISSGGDGHGKGAGGGVFLYRNVGEPGAPSFAEAETLVPRGPKQGSEPMRPDSGLYADLADFDGDGDLDLVVGGYSHWSPPPRELTADEESRAVTLEAEVKTLKSEQQGIFKKMFEAERAEADPAAQKKARDDFFAANRDRLGELAARIRAIDTELDDLRAKPKRVAFVWLYENLAQSPEATAAREP